LLGRVLLAALPDERLDAFIESLQPKAETPHTATGKCKLRELIRRARADGFVLVDQEVSSASDPSRCQSGTMTARWWPR
jgi:IclR family pca regulon transcriptional regulator